MLGKLLQGRYKIIQVLSSGGLCSTYLAQDIEQSLSTTYVVKHFQSASDLPESLPILRRLFNREVEALLKLGNYDRVPQLIAYFEEDEECFLVQEYVEGRTLSEELKPGKPWTEQQVVKLLQEGLSILAVIHSHGLIHRNLKPSNLIERQQDGELVLVSFGSVKQAGTQVVTAQGQTSASYAMGVPTRISVGTPGYMPTEQERGRPRPSSDIYALGIIGIQALTGLHPAQLPEDIKTGELLWQHQASVSSELAELLSKMVRYHFQDRYQTAVEALQALQPLIASNLLPKQSAAISEQPSNQNKLNSTALPNEQGTILSKEIASYQSYATPLNGSKSSQGQSSLETKQENRDKEVDTQADKFALSASSSALSHLVSNSKLPPMQSLGSEISTSTGIAPTNTDTAPSPNKFTLLLGIAIGFASAVALVVGSYFLRLPDTTPQSRQEPTSRPSNITTIGDIVLANTLTGHSDVVWSTAILKPDEQILASSSGDKTIKLWNLRTGKLLRTLTGSLEPIISLAASRDVQIASGSYAADGAIRLWNLKTGKLLPTLFKGSNQAWSIAVTPDGKTIASSSGDKTIRLWNWRTGELQRSLSGHSATVWSVAIGNDGQTLASGSTDKTINLWNLRTGQLYRTLTGHTGRVRSVAISNDGQFLASGSWDKTVKIWHLRTGRLLHTLAGHSAYVNTVAISPNGQILASGSDDSSVKLWNLNTGELIRTLYGHSGNVNSVNFTTDGRMLVSASEDKTIKLWRLGLGE